MGARRARTPRWWEWRLVAFASEPRGASSPKVPCVWTELDISPFPLLVFARQKCAHNVVSAALLPTAQIWEQPRCPFTDDQRGRMWSVPAVWTPCWWWLSAYPLVHVPAAAVRTERATVSRTSRAPRRGPDRPFHVSQFDESFEQLCEVRVLLPTSPLRNWGLLKVNDSRRVTGHA